jgi:NAD(P)-dependent dehydrogenase (short-subunit alcohol dehydrogenase family)
MSSAPAPGRLAGKSVLVTGGGAGIGKAIVERFLLEGAAVTVLDLSTGALGASESLLLVRGDVRRPADNAGAVAEAIARFGRLDVLVANAAVFDGFAALAELELEVLAEAALSVLETNVIGYLLAAAAAREELRTTRGSIILTLSNASFGAGGGGVVYTAGKHAALGMMRQLAYELAPEIRVNAVAPGGTLTGLAVAEPLRSTVSLPSPAERAERIRGRNALHVALEPADLVGPYLLLASDESRAMTGAVIRVDGGVDLVRAGGSPATPSGSARA